MAPRLIIQPQSELDIQAAAVWYEDQRSGLGGKFLDELDYVFHRIVENPRQFPRQEEAVHRALLRHFPYGVYFVIGDERVDVRLCSTCIDIPRCGKTGTSLGVGNQGCAEF